MVNVGESLVAIGFGTNSIFKKPQSVSKEALAYYNTLKSAELQLEKKQLGVKYYIKPTKLVLQSIFMSIQKLINKSKKSSKKVPKLAAT